MPFTFAHPSIVLPFLIKRTKYLDFTALVIGTMAPDFEYFIYFRPKQIVGHTFLGQLYFNLPIVFIVACIYHYILKKVVILNLPKPYCNKYYYLTKRSWRINSLFKFIVFCYSAILGSFTHLFWDSFTHKTGFFVKNIGLLTKYIDIANFKIPIYKILQHGSTVLGFVVIIMYLIAIQDKGISKSDYIQINKFYKFRFWSGVIVISMLIILLVIFKSNSLLLGKIIVTLIDGIFIGLIFMSFLTRALKIL
ncbi:DUF4184 family protein [Tepidibacter formicigenes]|jgi:hypothetical protein|uniref:DUF4184 family protein n=1 Tax=Tepidibacter formicigenes DSM 15518 TaxID=1123349 RepID=A0A1M6NJB8_9FIRM|nr:DUF4184 family protein [Tepidibacter formicigenes]SHJ95759.1 protein of unknown function [Tepidibacter formicigenes DSM 15518]